ncbi:hypothetical protein [Azospirillum doebereinerae]
MSKSSRRPPLGGIGETGSEIDRIREYGLSKGFIPTEPAEPAPPAIARPPTALPAPASAAPLASAPVAIRPAPTKPWQAMLPDYLTEELRQMAGREGTAQKVLVMRALRQAGYRVDDIDLQDLRRR